MTDIQQFAWTDRLKALSKVTMVDGSIDLLPPHVRRRVVALVDPVDIVVADVDVAELPDGPRRVRGTATFFTTNLVVVVTLDGATWSGKGAEDNPPIVRLRRLVDVVSVSAEGDSAGWAPNEWGDDPRGQYLLAFNVGTNVTFPARSQMHTPEIHDVIGRLMSESD